MLRRKSNQSRAHRVLKISNVRNGFMIWGLGFGVWGLGFGVSWPLITFSVSPTDRLDKVLRFLRVRASGEKVLRVLKWLKIGFMVWGLWFGCTIFVLSH